MGRFRSILFIIDNIRQPLDDIVLAVLQEADRLQLAQVSLPLLRTGAMVGFYEKTTGETANALLLGIHRFVNSQPVHAQLITVVAYHNVELKQYIDDRLPGR